MSVKEKQDNEEFKVISMDPEVIKGDANKLKLLITSYAAIMEVQDAYMQEEIEAKEDKAKEVETQIASGNLTEAEVKSANEELAALADQIETLSEVYAEFSKSRTRFMDLAKKALRLPSANFEQLAEKGYTTISGKMIELSSLESSYETAQKTLTDEENVDVFSNINNEDIKKEIERVINEDVVTDDKTGEEKAYKDYIPNEVDSDKFDEVATKLATDAKKNIDIVKVGRKIFNDALTTADAAKSNDKITAEESQTDHEAGQEYDEEIDNQTKIIPIAVSLGDEDAAIYEGNWAEDSINFDDDKSILDYISKLEQDVQEINASREEIKGQTQKALEDRNAAEAARNEAKDKSEKAKNDVAMLEKYMPRINELQEAKRKGQQDLDAEMAKLASTNSEKTAFETEMQVYAEETRQSLEKLKEMKAILNSEEPEQKKEDLPSNVLK